MSFDPSSRFAASPHAGPERLHGARRLAVMRHDNIGDVVMLGPALRALDAALPAAEIVLLASPAGALAAPLLPWVDRVLVDRVLWQDAGGQLAFDPDREAAFVERLAAEEFDAALIFTSWSQTPFGAAAAAYLAGIPVRVGQAAAFGGGLLSLQLEPLPDAAHQVDRNLHLVAGLGVPVRNRDLELRLPLEAASSAARLLQRAGIGSGEPFIVLAPGASCEARRFDPLRFAAAADEIGHATGWRIMVVGAERDRPACEPILEAVPRARSLVGLTGVPELAAVLARASLLLGADSAPMHIADAFGVPQVIAFAGTDLASQWAPRRSPARLLARPVPCAPCGHFTCPYDRHPCLDLEPSELVAAAGEVLSADLHRRPVAA